MTKPSGEPTYLQMGDGNASDDSFSGFAGLYDNDEVSDFRRAPPRVTHELCVLGLVNLSSLGRGGCWHDARRSCNTPSTLSGTSV